MQVHVQKRKLTVNVKFITRLDKEKKNTNAIKKAFYVIVASKF